FLSLAERSDPKVMSMHKELSVKSRVRGDFHARFCERVRVKLPRSTRPVALENVNGLIRQYIPKNTCFSNISQQQITKIMQKINTRPREKLNFSTPRECFYKKML
ncbi:MAG: hypothetical protein MR670_06175, partial [Prevotella sp.]|nr:hypothetical protein [Prevotella sp.]